jgi:hypothetical protein
VVDFAHKDLIEAFKRGFEAGRDAAGCVGGTGNLVQIHADAPQLSQLIEARDGPREACCIRRTGA